VVHAAVGFGMYCLCQITIEMLSTDLVAELRAEVSRWWEQMLKHRREQEANAATTSSQLSATSSVSSSVITPMLGAMLVEGPVRMISLGQELSVDVDEKTLADMQFKDSQVDFSSPHVATTWVRVGDNADAG